MATVVLSNTLDGVVDPAEAWVPLDIEEVTENVLLGRGSPLLRRIINEFQTHVFNDAKFKGSIDVMGKDMPIDLWLENLLQTHWLPEFNDDGNLLWELILHGIVVFEHQPLEAAEPVNSRLFTQLAERIEGFIDGPAPKKRRVRIRALPALEPYRIKILPLHTLQMEYRPVDTPERYQFRIFKRPDRSLKAPRVMAYDPNRKPLQNVLVYWVNDALTSDGSMNSILRTIKTPLLLYHYQRMWMTRATGEMASPSYVELIPQPPPTVQNAFMSHFQQGNGQAAVDADRALAKTANQDATVHAGEKAAQHKRTRESEEKQHKDEFWDQLRRNDSLLEAFPTLSITVPNALDAREPRQLAIGHTIEVLASATLPPNILEQLLHHLQEILNVFHMSVAYFTQHFSGQAVEASKNLIDAEIGVFVQFCEAHVCRVTEKLLEKLCRREKAERLEEFMTRLSEKSELGLFERQQIERSLYLIELEKPVFVDAEKLRQLWLDGAINDATYYRLVLVAMKLDPELSIMEQEDQTNSSIKREQEMNKKLAPPGGP